MITFTLKAFPFVRKDKLVPCIKEYFYFERPATPEQGGFSTEGVVDADIIKENPKEYAEFQEFLKKEGNALIEKLIASFESK